MEAGKGAQVETSFVRSEFTDMCSRFGPELIRYAHERTGSLEDALDVEVLDALSGLISRLEKQSRRTMSGRELPALADLVRSLSLDDLTLAKIERIYLSADVELRELESDLDELLEKLDHGLDDPESARLLSLLKRRNELSDRKAQEVRQHLKAEQARAFDEMLPKAGHHVRGKIIACSAAAGMAILNQGENHGAKTGMPVTIFRADRFVASGNISEANRDWSAVRLIRVQVLPRPGDEVTNRWVLPINPDK
jgi:Skp family chaperone for outer membrane proteins